MRLPVQNTGDLERTLGELHSLAERHGDRDRAHIYEELALKANMRELTFTFCGHFSAGKSSMINALCGKELLPSGPVPTSANIVSIRSGAPRAIVRRRLTDGAEDELLVSPEQMREYCRLGGEYSSIEVWEDVALLGRSGVLMDTPGVDSTDEGHQRATETALHLADIVFYVMDYNHVESENNLSFAKNLSEWGKPLYLIVNQIDKHHQNEIPIEVYREQVESAFRSWGVSYAGVLFTSLKDQGHEFSAWENLPLLIRDLLKRREELLAYSLSQSMHHTAEESLESLREAQSEDRERLLQELDGTGPQSPAAEAAELDEEEQRLDFIADEAKAEIRKRLDAHLENANLMPADIRDLVSRLAESLAPGFRTGLFTTAAKKERERAVRLTALEEALRRQLASQLEIHVIQLLREWGESLELWRDEEEAQLKLSFPHADSGWLSGAIKPGAPTGGEALLQLCRGLALELRGGFRRAALGSADQQLAALPPLLAKRRAELALRRAAAGRRAAAAAALAELDRAEQTRASELAALLPPRLALAPGLLPEVSAYPRAARSAAARPQRPPLAPADPVSAARPAAAGHAPAEGRRRLGEAARLLERAAARLAAEPAMASAARSLAARAADLDGGRFTLALLGAFSAGKSSFANALLGEEVLPVSPHPATAAVNRILAPEGENRHGTARVVMKSREEFRDDLRYSFSVLQLGEPDAGSWTEAVNRLPERGRGLHPSLLPHAGFVRAAARGWKEAERHLGIVRTVELPEYRELVAEESKACFVRSIDLFYESPVTHSGIVLVDTPGADSLHARHTGVTFSYMKEADAICFVTYYNHAFSKADRGLLMQLGRIRESFELDKMFFIVNASDLADNEEELGQVLEQVAGNLRAAGIGRPRIYALSSLRALEARKSGIDPEPSFGFGLFENELWRFAGQELPGLALSSARESLSSVRKRAEEWREMASTAESEREAEVNRIGERRKAAENALERLSRDDRVLRDIRREGEELLYHVRQRLGFALGGMFQESFHPSLLRSDAGPMKEAFAACGRELWRTAGGELEAELWATTLRLSSAGRRLVLSAADAIVEELGGSGLTCEGEAWDERSWPAPGRLEAALPEAALPEADWDRWWPFFKSPKAFFEGGGRDALRRAAEPQLKEAIAAAAAKAEPALLAHYETLASEALATAARELASALKEREIAMLSLLKGGDTAERWAALAQELQQIESGMASL
ncbi:dynamin family protein [Paenibacillus sp. HN-1]|uniref:dynamin family protein n=1 Tax=Paenibacillus TaxID=44249 RepID=UPI001CA916C6|nr:MULTISPECIES: dynamin family protein [Paenibacillus]MBY9081710.1 dynamin family protein [Paenibacillus sp. CGMCC 1.18879]MBY9083579.1 dynamin family protein [Paenibacillus sinensis]